MNERAIVVHESPARTLLVAAVVCVVCSLFVSLSVQWLGGRRAENQRVLREARITEILARQPALTEMLASLDEIDLRARVVELGTGEYADELDPATFDPLRAEQDPLQSVELAPERDLAKLGRRALYAVVYEVRRGEQLELVILPVHGAGYVTTIRGYLALERDCNTVAGLAFYEQSETPGLGGVIDDPDWQARWDGKRLRDAEGVLRISVGKSSSAASAADAEHRVDGISGATRTSSAVSQLVRFWVGEDGFGPYLARLRS